MPLFLELREFTDDLVSLRVYTGNSITHEARNLKGAEITELAAQMESDYYVRLPREYAETGQKLYAWLDGPERWLSRAIADCSASCLVLAIDAAGKLAHLPWELLHDGRGFLVGRIHPAVVPLRWQPGQSEPYPPPSRHFRLLFMAADPEAVEPKLDFEREEAKILEKTQGKPLEVRVEESGCIEELARVWSRSLEDFDAFHFTGHATMGEQPYFITESAIGERQETRADDLAQVFQFRWCPLTFLSGCRTGQAANNGAVPSLAEQLLERGARAVLAWGRPVADTEATAAAAHLYGKLADGYRLTEALASTYQQLLKDNSPPAEVLHRCWWQEAESSSEEQGREIHRLAVAGEAADIAVEIADALAAFWHNRSRYREAMKTCQETLVVVEDYRIRHHLARAKQALGEVPSAAADYQQALAACPPDDEREKAAILHNWATLKAHTGDLGGALALYEQSLALKESIGNVQGKAATLYEMAILKADTGEIESALALYQESLALKESIGNVQGKATTLHCMANLKADTGDLGGALALYEQSLALKETIGNVQGKAATLHQMAVLKADTGDIGGALALYEQSLALTESIGNVQGKAATLHCMASLKADTGDLGGALALYEQSLALTESIGDVRGKAATLAMRAKLLAQQGDFERAIAGLQESIAILQQLGSPEAEKVQEILTEVVMMKLMQSPEGEAMMQAILAGEGEEEE